MKHIMQTLIVGLGLGLCLGMAPGPAAAGVRVVGTWHSGGYWHGGGYWRGGYYPGYRWSPGWRTGVALGIGLGLDLYPYPSYYGYPAYPVVVAPPPAYYDGHYDGYYDGYYANPAPRSHPPAKADPVFVPRFGQGAGQTEADRQGCNRWATTQPDAMADAGEFHRKSLACMEGRGYEVR